MKKEYKRVCIFYVDVVCLSHFFFQSIKKLFFYVIQNTHNLFFAVFVSFTARMQKNTTSLMAGNVDKRQSYVWDRVSVALHVGNQVTFLYSFFQTPSDPVRTIRRWSISGKMISRQSLSCVLMTGLILQSHCDCLQICFLFFRY